MKFLCSFVSILLVGALVAFSPTDGTAGTVGKVQGVVQDDTGNPLPGANVVVEGTQRGATTDSDGYYAILGIDPGRQRVVASMIGYNTSAVENVSVKADFTTTLDFTLSETAIEAVEMVVTAKRPPVEPDRTSSRYVVDIFEIQNVPLARNTEDLIELQPGVSLDGALRLRGSDHVQNTTSSQAMYYEVDGVRMINDDGSANYQQWTPLNKGALQEISVIVGGMDAEYGSASGGVLSLVSRESGARFGGQAEVRIHPPGKKHFGPNVYESAEFKRMTGLENPWSDQDFVNYERGAANSELPGQKHHVRQDYTDNWGQFVEGSLNGPISDNAGFFVNARTSRVQARWPDRWGREPPNYQGSGNVTFRSGANLKFKVGGIYGYREQSYGMQTMTSALGGVVGGNNWWRKFYPDLRVLFHPEGFSSRGTIENTEKVAYVTATHSLSPKTFYDIRASFQQTTVGVGGAVAEGQGSQWVTSSIPRDDWGFFLLWSNHNTVDENRKRMTLKADVTSQVQKSILGKAGFELVRYDVFLDNFQEHFGHPGRWRQLVGVGDPYVGQEGHILNHLGGYVQTKMEFEGLVINAGVRGDILLMDDMWPNDAFVWPHYWSLTRFRNALRTSADPMKSISPRLGISHPITERSTVRFHTGVFHTYPDKVRLYKRWYWGLDEDTDVNGNGQIDQLEKENALTGRNEALQYSRDIEPEKTIAFEAGVDWNFAGDFVLQVTAYQKDLKGKVMRHSTLIYPDKSLVTERASGSVLGNHRGTNSSRGFELSFRKMFSQMTSFNVSWNIAWVEQQQTREERYLLHDATYLNGPNFFSGVTANADGSESPKAPTAAERADFVAAAEKNLANAHARAGTMDAGLNVWHDVRTSSDSDPGQYIQMLERAIYGAAIGPETHDRRSVGAAQFLFSAPQDFHIKALAGARATMVWKIQGGTPFRYTPPLGVQETRKGPIQTMTDVNFEKDFSVGQTGLITGFVEVRNLWNQRADIANTRDFNYVLHGLSLPEPDDANYLKFGDYKDVTRWALGVNSQDHGQEAFGLGPREFVLGARLSF